MTTRTLPPPPPYSPPSQAKEGTKSDLEAVQSQLPPSPPYEGNVAPAAAAHPDVSTVPARPEGRDTRGRFAPGNSGRPKGARSRLVTELEQAMELAAPEIVRILIGRAQCGDGSMEAAKYILERIAPSRRGRLVEIENFPDIQAAHLFHRFPGIAGSR
jgi:hypothetical protein